jgi:succinate dehydrogenase/fumarate reductase cytochrome b subunit
MDRSIAIPRNTTRQAEGALLGNVARLAHRISGAIVVVFVLMHVVVQMIRHVPLFAPLNAAMPWLGPLQHIAVVHAVLYAAVAFHTLYGLRLMAGEVGFSVPYRASLYGIGGASVLVGLLAFVPHG